MAKQSINIGTVANDGTGSPLRTGGDIINDNFTELYTGAETVAATEKTTPVDADVMPIQDSAASDVKKKLSWSNIKATLKTYFDTLYGTVSAVASNTTHRTSDGKDHSDVVLNNTHRSSDGSDHSAVVANTAKVSFPEAPSDGTPYARQDAGWVAAGGGSSDTISAYKASDESRTSTTTLAIDSDLYLDLDANSTYIIRAYIRGKGSVTGDNKITFNYDNTYDIGDFTFDLDNLNAIPISFGATQSQVLSPTTIKLVNAVICIKTTNAGRFGFYWAQNVSDATASTIERGSAMFARKYN